MCDAPEVAVDATIAADRLGLEIDTEVSDSPVPTACTLLGQGSEVAVALTAAQIGPESLIALREAKDGRSPVPVALLGASAQAIGLGADLGMAVCGDVDALVSVCAVLSRQPNGPWAWPTHALSPVDRTRVGEFVGGDKSAHWGRLDGGLVGLVAKGQRVPIGAPAQISAALQALRGANMGSRPRVPKVADVDETAVRNVLLGPARALSDPASKDALSAYDVPLPIEELCVTPSRAASEAARIGFPVRVSLASPDLRVWDHADLAVDHVDNGARVRDAFRQIMGLAKTHDASARLLGVMVSAASTTVATLRVQMTPVAEGLIHTSLGFADQHGLAADDRIETILPTTAQGLHASLSRLRGASLILGGNSKETKAAVSQIGDVLLRLAAFVHAWRNEVTHVTIDPLAVLLDGQLEIREACVTVGDAFSRELQASG